MGQMLTAKQLAEVKGCSFQYIQKKIKEGKLQAVETVNSRNRKVYQIPLESLDEELQQRWYQIQKEQIAEGAVPLISRIKINIILDFSGSQKIIGSIFLNRYKW